MNPPRLPIDLYSPDQLSVHIQGLRELLGKRRDAAIQSRIVGKGPGVPVLSLSPTMQSLLRLNNVKLENANDLETLLKSLEQLRTTAPIVHLTFATLPNHTFAQQLTVWFRNQIHPQTLLRFVMKREIGGGMVLRAGSTIYDLSFRTQLLRHKDKITEIFGRV